MLYLIIEIEITETTPPISIPQNAAGIAILLRHQGRPIDFWLEPIHHQKTNGLNGDVLRQIKKRSEKPGIFENNAKQKSPVGNNSQTVSLTIAICTKDRAQYLARSLKSLLQVLSNGKSSNLRYEVLVIDNAPSDNRTREYVQSLPESRYLCEPRQGLNFARNRALKESSGDYLIFLDDDVIPDSYWLTGFLETIAKDPDAAAITGQILPQELVTEAQILFEKRGGFRKGFKRIRYHQNKPADPLFPCRSGMLGTGANMAFRREILLELGGFDEALDTGPDLPGGGDLDIFYRIIRGGYLLVYEPRYLVFHQHRRDMESLRIQYQNSWGSSYMAFVAKSFRADPEMRLRFLGLIGGWFSARLWNLFRSMLGCHILPPRMVLSEIRGGAMGLLGGYSRSSKRVKRIREECA